MLIKNSNKMDIYKEIKKKQTKSILIAHLINNEI